MAERVSGRPAAPTDATISGADGYGQDLSGKVHERVMFRDLELTESTGDGVRFANCTFVGAQITCARFTDSAFENCTFIRCSFFDTELTECKFLGSTFDDCTFDQLRVTGGEWSFVGLPGADLHRARFTGVRMREADLSGARCQGAIMTKLDLGNANLSRVDLTRCDLRGSDLSALDPNGVELARAIVDWEQAIVLARNLGLDVRPE